MVYCCKSLNNRLRRVLSTLGLLLTLSAAAQTPQSSLDGFWDLKSVNVDGHIRHMYFEFHQKGDVLIGRLFGRSPGGTALTGTIKDGQLSFYTLPPNFVPGTPPAYGSTASKAVFEGSFINGKLTIIRNTYNGEKISGLAEPATEAEATPPPPLPLPTPKSVPGNGLVRTPPMGWNSWNRFAGRIADADIRSMADAMVASGMAKLGYTYINIDDTWQGGRNSDGTIQTNAKFPDMKALADYVHSKGLKIGIYSSPGTLTCAGYEGSSGHETQDAKTYAGWGFDYLKYDLCSARGSYISNQANQQGLYQKMGEALQKTGRPIVFSLCQYGENDVWKWGAATGGNLWRTTGDIRDTWDSMDKIGFSQLAISSFTRSGHWNDPDMLEIGNGGMSAEEYRTHMSLWSMLAAPLLAGNDIRAMSPETKSILMNQEVIAIDQDEAARPTETLMKSGLVETLWRPLADGSVVVGIFNRSGKHASSSLRWSELPAGLGSKKVTVRDLWKHADVPVTGSGYETEIPAHGVSLLRIAAR